MSDGRGMKSQIAPEKYAADLNEETHCPKQPELFGSEYCGDSDSTRLASLVVGRSVVWGFGSHQNVVGGVGPSVGRISVAQP
jgi:hypothetical protein